MTTEASAGMPDLDQASRPPRERALEAIRAAAYRDLVAYQLLIADVQAGLDVGGKLQSWPAAMGGPSADDLRIGVSLCAGRWYSVRGDHQARERLERGKLAALKVEGMMNEAMAQAGVGGRFKVFQRDGVMGGDIELVSAEASAPRPADDLMPRERG